MRTHPKSGNQFRDATEPGAYRHACTGSIRAVLNVVQPHSQRRQSDFVGSSHRDDVFVVEVVTEAEDAKPGSKGTHGYSDGRSHAVHKRKGGKDRKST